MTQGSEHSSTAVRTVGLTFYLLAVTLTASCIDDQSGLISPTSPISPSVTAGSSQSSTRIIALSADIAFGEVAVGDTATRALTISNTGNNTLTWSGISTGISDVTASPTSGTVTANESQEVTLTFSPLAAISFSSTLTVTSDKTSGTHTIDLWGTGVDEPVAATRIIELSGNVPFGEVIGGGTATSTLTITNTGNSTLTWSDISTGTSVVTANPTTGTVEAGESQAVTLTFKPDEADEGKTYTGTVTVTSDATSGTNTRTFSGSTLTATRIIALSGDLAFGEVLVGATASKTLTISNTGNGTLTWTGITTTIENLPATSTPTSGTVPPGESRPVTLIFAPNAPEDTTYNGTLTVHSDKTSGDDTKAFSGTGVAATRIITLSGDMTFGEVTVGDTLTRTLTISNTGNNTLTWSGISTGNSVFTASPTSGTVAAGGSQAITLTFSPAAVTAYSGTLTVTSDKTNGSHTSTLSGTGGDAPYNCCPPPNRLSVVQSVAAEIGYPGSGVDVRTLTQKVAERLHAEDHRWGRRINITGPLGKDTVAYKASDGRPYSIDIVLGSMSNDPRVHWAPHGFVGGTWVTP